MKYLGPRHPHPAAVQGRRGRGDEGRRRAEERSGELGRDQYRLSRGSMKKDPKKSPRETGGPVVKSGPTAGQSRARNQDGKWRRKRSDTGKPRTK